MKKHPLLVSVLCLLWLVTSAHIVLAATPLPPYSQDFYGFDFESFLLACATGLIGAGGRTIYSLATNKIIVGSVWREALKDGVLGVIGGGLAWAIITFLAMLFPQLINSLVRMVGIVLAGAWRGKWANLLGAIVDLAVRGAKLRVLSWASGKPMTLPDLPSSVIVPPSDQ